MASTIFNLGAVKLLKKILRFQESDVQIITGNSADPTVTAVDAVAGSIYIRANGEVYVKNTSGNNTDFRKLTDQAALDAHVNDISNAHAASAISTVPAGNLAASNVQDAVNELQSDIDTRALDNAVIKKDGSVAFTADQSMGGFKLTGLAAPTAPTHAATKEYVDNSLEGLKPKQAVRAATTANITLSGTQTVDTVSLIAGDRVLVKDQSTASQNGIYVVAAGAWSRATDFDSVSPIDEVNKAYVAVQEGSQAGKLFVQFGTVTTIGTDAINFTFFNSVSGITGGDGITVSGSNIEVDHDGQGLQFVAGQLALELDGATLTKGASGLKLSDTAVTPGSFGSATQVPSFTVDQQGRLTAAAATNIAIPASQITDFNEAAQDAVGGILTDSSTIDFTYDDVANTITAIVIDGSITNAKLATGIDVAKIADGSVSNAEFQYLDGVTSSIQTQLDGKASTTLNNLGTTSINADLLPSADITRSIGSSALRFNTVNTAVLRAGLMAPDTVTYTVTGDFTAGSAAITNVVGTLPATSLATTYTVYAPGYTTRISGSTTAGDVTNITSISGTTVNMGTTALASATGVTLYISQSTIFRTNDGTNPLHSANMIVRTGTVTASQSGAIYLYSGFSTTGRTGDLIIGSGAASSGGTTGDVYLTAGTTSGTRGKVVLAGSSIDVSSKNVINVLDPVNPQDAATKNYVESVAANKEPLHNTSLNQGVNGGLTANVTNQVINSFTFAHATYNGCIIEYRIKKGTLVRVGRIMVATDGTNVALNDSFVETVDSTIVFDAVINGANVEIRQTNTETGSIAITFQQNRFLI